MLPYEVENANVVLLGKVSVPAFFQKLANDYNIDAKSKDDREVLVNLADIVHLTIDNYLANHQKKNVKRANDWLDVAIKSLADIAASAEGYNSADHMIQSAVKKAQDRQVAESHLNDPEVLSAITSLTKAAASDEHVENLLRDLEDADRVSSSLKSKRRHDDDEDDEDEED